MKTTKGFKTSKTTGANNTFKGKVAVLGAGPAGLAAADQLLSQGYEVHVYESSSSVGGMCKSLKLWGQRVDLGPHRFFTPHQRVMTLWQSLVGTDYAWVPRKTRIYFRNKFFSYPITLWPTLKALGPQEAIRCGLSFLQSFLHKFDESHFEGWAQSQFGERLYELFFKGYTEKLWGLPCKDLDQGFAKRKIKGLHLLHVLKETLLKNKTFETHFLYPAHGTGQVYEALAARVTKKGAQLKTSVPVTGLSKTDRGLSVQASGEAETYDSVVSTLPLDLVYGFLYPERSFRGLGFRHTVLVYLEVKGAQHFEDNWIYINSPHVQLGRVTNFNNWSPKMKHTKKKTILCLEYWCGEEDPHWKDADQVWMDRAQKELQILGLIQTPLVTNLHVQRVPKSYPIMKRGYEKQLNQVVEDLHQVPGLYLAGRYGAYSYNNQDHSLLMGLQAADQIARSTQKFVSPFAEDYEENILISEV